MPRIDFEVENKAATVNYDYPKLKLKKGERARILVVESPQFEYVHTLRKPQIINGVPQYTTVERKNGTSYQSNKMDFVTKALCVGDMETLQEKGSDPRNCPMCALARDFPDYTKPPQRRFAMNVIRYRTKGGTVDVAVPFSVEVLVWSFTDRVFNKLADFKSEWGPLINHDLLLGPCSDEDFQTFDVSVASKAEWQAADDRKKLLAETLKENKIEDLTVAIGTPKQRSWMEEDVEVVKEAWRQVSGAVAESNGSLETDLAGLLDSSDNSPVSDSDVDANGVILTDPPNAGSSVGDDLLAGFDDLAGAAAASDSGASDSGASDDVDNFDDLLKGI